MRRLRVGERPHPVRRAERARFGLPLLRRPGQEVALEVLWVGTLAVPVGSLIMGDEMRANFGVFLTFRDGLITRQRNYDCFQPF